MKPWRIISLFLLLLLGVDALGIPAPKTAVPGFFGVSVSRARYYNPEVGRFWTRDTYEGSNRDPLSLHRYGYCGTDPVNRRDPSGLSYGDRFATLLDAVKEAAFELWKYQVNNHWEYFTWFYIYPASSAFPLESAPEKRFSYTKPHTSYMADEVTPDQAPPYNLSGWMHTHPNYFYDVGLNESFSSHDIAFAKTMEQIPAFLVTERLEIKQYLQGEVSVVSPPVFPSKKRRVISFLASSVFNGLAGSPSFYIPSF